MDSNGKKAWLVIPPSPGPGKSSNPQYLSIPEHEKQGDIEVLEINEKESTVKILNAGVPAELNFKDNGLPTPAAMPVPAAPINPHGIVPAPGTPPPAAKTTAAPAMKEGQEAVIQRWLISAQKLRLSPSVMISRSPSRTIRARVVRSFWPFIILFKVS